MVQVATCVFRGIFVLVCASGLTWKPSYHNKFEGARLKWQSLTIFTLSATRRQGHVEVVRFSWKCICTRYDLINVRNSIPGILMNLRVELNYSICIRSIRGHPILWPTDL